MPFDELWNNGSFSDKARGHACRSFPRVPIISTSKISYSQTAHELRSSDLNNTHALLILGTVAFPLFTVESFLSLMTLPISM